MSYLPIAVAVPAEPSLFELAAAVDFLKEPPRGYHGAWYDLSLIGSSCSGRLGLVIAPLDRSKNYQTLVVLPARGNAPDTQLVSYLRSIDLMKTRIVSICTGALTLAEAGLLHRRRATTHWRHGHKLREIDPTIRLVPDVLYVDEGDVLTSAGAAAGIDLMLHLVRTDFGIEAATQLARAMVVAPHREGGQAQFLDTPIMVAGTGRLNSLIVDMRVHLDRQYTIDDLARGAGMSRRTFQRHFAAITGLAPRDWLIEHRIDRAIALLREGNDKLEDVAARCGFGGADQMRHHFRERLGQPPSRYMSR